VNRESLRQRCREEIDKRLQGSFVNAGCCLLSLIVQFDKKDSFVDVSSGLLGLTVQLWHVLVDRADLTYANR
jgi:hypothetical protein